MSDNIPQTTFVHRYKYSHESKRKRFRRLLKEGKVKMIHRSRDGWMYQRVECTSKGAVR